MQAYAMSTRGIKRYAPPLAVDAFGGGAPTNKDLAKFPKLVGHS